MRGSGPGALVDGRFALVDRLGGGGMGTVWRARDIVLERDVALKEVRPVDPDRARSPARSRTLRERVLREARALARIDHANVVTIHHIVDSDELEHPWLVMEMVTGGPLEARLAGGPLEPVEVAALGRGVLGALRAAHAVGIVHRDVKPGNVLLRADGTPVLTDFGIADLDDASRLTATGGLTGSPAYIAPERLHGREGDPASDLWSLGMLLYVAVEGHHPMRRPTTAATLAAVMEGVVPPPTRAGALTPALAAVLVPGPADRPGPERLDALLAEAAAPGSPPGPVAASTPPAGPFPVFPEFPPRPPTASSAGAGRGGVVALAVAGGAAVLAALAVAAVLVVPGMVERLGPGTPEAGGLRHTVAPPVSAAPPPVPSRSPSPSPSPSGLDGPLHTPDGLRAMIRAFEQATGTADFSGLTVYPTYAAAQVPVPGRSRATDRYTYRDGRVVRQSSPGPRALTDATVKLSSIDWDILPALFRRADRTLNVPAPSSRYVIVNPAWTFADDRPVIMVYLSDRHGGGYLAADLKGGVVKTVKAD